MVNENPFLAPSPLPFAAPDFRAIKVEHYMPAFEAGMKQQLEEAVAIANQTDEPTFENTLVALEKSGDILRRVQAVFFNLSNSNTSEEIQAIEEKVAPAWRRMPTTFSSIRSYSVGFRPFGTNATTSS